VAVSRRPTASPQRAIKVEIENVEVPCLLLSPGFYYKTNALDAQHSDFDVAVWCAVVCKRLCCIGSEDVNVCVCVV
jgi:hypothetical protein